ncbi:flavodoxin domain-containing protein [Aquibium microcysteis]|uniref:flavodoxin domain-containing protein n=1 Tax=Aquibium microcysteis TaxID=675281 RepID=UPI00165D239C|nr:flavodoxin domain-containing protein [Aquibium microcysteis]
MIVILYASTSGATRTVAQAFSARLGGAVTVDIGGDARVDAMHHGADLLLMGSPTYGHGDWHHAWSSRFEALLPVLGSARAIALFGLGDARFHSDTFCGALGRLHDALDQTGLRPIGTSQAGCYPYRSTPSLRQGAFPGFVLDYRQDRRSIDGRIAEWLLHLRDCRPEPRNDSPPAVAV